MKYYRARPHKGSTRFIDLFVHRLVFQEEGKYIGDRSYIICSEIDDWCVANIGGSFREWAYSIRRGDVTMYFKTKEDAFAFKLRWL